MTPQADGSRHCAQCERNVQSSGELDEAGFEQLVETAREGAACARFELDPLGRPRLAAGVLASVLVMGIGGCASSDSVFTRSPWAAMWRQPKVVELGPEEGAQLVGHVTHSDTDEPMDGVWVMLEGPGLAEPLQLITEPDGGFGFVNLPGGTYTLRVQHHIQEVEVAPHTRVLVSSRHAPGSIMLGGIFEIEAGFDDPGPHLVNPDYEDLDPS